MATTLRYGPSTACGGHGPTTACQAALCRGAAWLGHLKAHSSPIVNRQAEDVRSPRTWSRRAAHQAHQMLSALCAVAWPVTPAASTRRRQR